MMKKSTKITFSAVLSALATVFMLGSYFPYLTYTIPAVAGLFIMIILMEVGTYYAVGGYIVSAFLSIIAAEKEAAVLYICLFGFYPILKAVIERLRNPIFEWIIKLILFNVCAVLSYGVATFIFGISFDELNKTFKWGIYIFWAFSNPVFVLYDISVSRMAMFYSLKIHNNVKKIFK